MSMNVSAISTFFNEAHRKEIKYEKNIYDIFLHDFCLETEL